MKTSGWVIAFLFALLVGYVVSLLTTHLRSRIAQPTAREFKSTDEFVQWLSDEAVKDAQTGNGVKLDYTPESIKSVEQILGKLHEQYVKAPSSISIKGLSAAYGAYIGEVIRRTEPNARWERDHPIAEESYPLMTDTGELFPMNWCWKRIENGDEDNVWMKYRAYKEGVFSGARKK